MSIDAYTDRYSYLPGSPVAVHCTSTCPLIDVEVSRVGANCDVVWKRRGLEVFRYPVPENAFSHGCGWPVGFCINTAAGWRSGYYRVRMSARDEAGHAIEGETFFVLRAPQGGRADILLVLSTNTYNAYNTYGGASLYTGGAARVSFERPMAAGFLSKPEPAGRRAAVEGPARHTIPYLEWARRHRVDPYSASGGWHNWELPFVEWAEGNRYRIDFAVNADLEFDPSVLDGYRLVLSVGHDEYWSWGMRDALEGFIERGGNVAFFSGNTAFWQVRFEDEGRAMVCYKYECERDPVLGTAEERRLSSCWSDALIGRPENRMTGVSFTRGGYVLIGGGVSRGSGGYTVYRDRHWVFEGTGLGYGDVFGQADRIVAYEADGCEFTMRDGLPQPTGRDGTPESFEILAISPAALWDQSMTPPIYEEGITDLEFAAWRVLGNGSAENQAKLAHGHAVMGVYERGGTVFTCGCTDWAYGLKGGDETVARITRRVIDRLST